LSSCLLDGIRCRLLGHRGGTDSVIVGLANSPDNEEKYLNRTSHVSTRDTRDGNYPLIFIAVQSCELSVGRGGAWGGRQSAEPLVGWIGVPGRTDSASGGTQPMKQGCNLLGQDCSGSRAGSSSGSSSAKPGGTRAHRAVGVVHGDELHLLWITMAACRRFRHSDLDFRGK
jgi:hypothetical protein